jgi:hypothetical protein
MREGGFRICLLTSSGVEAWGGSATGDGTAGICALIRSVVFVSEPSPTRTNSSWQCPQTIFALGCIYHQTWLVRPSLLNFYHLPDMVPINKKT